MFQGLYYHFKIKMARRDYEFSDVIDEISVRKCKLNIGPA